MSSAPIPPELWSDARHRDGLAAEGLAADWLIREGWDVVARRYALGRHDLDLIIRRGSLVAFVEVKWRRGLAFGAPEAAVGPRKRRTVEQLAWSWILRHGEAGDQYRFDVVALTGPLPNCRIRHLADAWRPGWR